MTIIKKKKIAAADFNPKKILGLGQDVMRLVLGTVGGIATGLTESLAPTGEVFIGLRGSFRFQSAENDDIMLGPVLWMPTGFDDDIKALFLQTDDKCEPNGPSEISFVYEIGVVRAGNPQGYSWYATPLLNVIKEQENDPVAMLFAEAKGQLAISDQSGDKTDEQPERVLEAPKAAAHAKK